MLNIYTLAGKKFLKWTNEDADEQYYTALDNIRTFAESKNGLLQFIVVGQDYYCNTSYKFSELEDYAVDYTELCHGVASIGIKEIG